MGGLSNEKCFKSAPEKQPYLILMVLILLLTDAIFHNVGAWRRSLIALDWVHKKEDKWNPDNYMNN